MFVVNLSNGLIMIMQLDSVGFTGINFGMCNLGDTTLGCSGQGKAVQRLHVADLR